jgi:hypothetical protein
MSFGVVYDLDFNQINPKVVASDVVGDAYPTFPTTSTGSNLGNYNHMGIDGQNNNIWDFLNISGLLQGGFNWWNSNNTQAPLLLGTLNDVGLTINRSTDEATLVPLPNITFSGATFVITETPINAPPWNIVGYGTPIQVLHNTAHLTIGTTYYAAGLNAQTVQVATNPDGTGILDTSDLSVAQQPILATLGGAPITTTKISLLTGDTLSIKNDPNYDATSLSDTGLTLTNSDATNIHIDASNFNLNGNAKTVAIDENSLIITQGTNNSSLNSTSLVINSNYNAGNPLNVVNIQNYYMEILDNDQGISSNFNAAQTQFIDGNKTGTISAAQTQHIDSTTNTTSLLTSSDLTFNNVSLKSAVATNTSNIATLQGGVIQTPIFQLCSPLVYGTSPSLPPQRMFTSTSASNIINQGYNGWYFRNFTAGVNIGWNAGFASSTSIVGNLLQLSFSFITPITTTSPQISVYTSPPTGGNFYNSRRSYVNQNTPTINTPYIYYINFNGYTGVPFKSGHTPILLTNTNVSNVGAFASNETLYFWSVGTNSATLANTVELVISNMTFKMNSGSNGIITQPYNFNNSDVITTPQFSNQSAGTRTITPYDYATQILCSGNVTISNANLRAQDAQFFITCVNAKTPSGPINITFTGSGGSTVIQVDPSVQLVLIWTGTYWII